MRFVRFLRPCSLPSAISEVPTKDRKHSVFKPPAFRNWDAAQKLVRNWEVSPQGGGVTINRACEKFLSNATARRLSEPTLKKIKHITEELKRENRIHSSWRSGLLQIRKMPQHYISNCSQAFYRRSNAVDQKHLPYCGIRLRRNNEVHRNRGRMSKL